MEHEPDGSRLDSVTRPWGYEISVAPSWLIWAVRLWRWDRLCRERADAICQVHAGK
jgi:hypothetical protein